MATTHTWERTTKRNCNTSTQRFIILNWRPQISYQTKLRTVLFWEAHIRSTGQEIALLLANHKIHHRVQKSPQVHGPVQHFVKRCFISPRPICKLMDRPQSAVRDCLFNTFAVTLQLRGCPLHLRPEDAPRRGHKDPLSTDEIIYISNSFQTILLIL
jgi:hypothetical protein